MRTHYANLQIAENASPEVIKGAYKYLSQKWHPDKHPDKRAEAEKISRIINRAYTVLSDPVLRKEHDDWIRCKRDINNKDNTNNIKSTPTEKNKSTVKHSLTRRTWLIILFISSTTMIFIILPSRILSESWEWKYLGAVGFWIWIAHYSYTSLFNPNKIKQINKQPSVEIINHTNRNIINRSLVVATLLFCVILIYMMAIGFDFHIAITSSAFAGLLTGGIIYLISIMIHDRHKPS